MASIFPTARDPVFFAFLGQDHKLHCLTVNRSVIETPTYHAEDSGFSPLHLPHKKLILICMSFIAGEVLASFYQLTGWLLSDMLFPLASH